jgi:hypothetical protein
MRLQAQQRGHRLQVVLDAVVDLLGEHAAHHRAAVLERDRGMVRDRREQRTLVGGEGGIPVDDELADLAPLPAQGQAHVLRAGTAFGPGDVAVFQDECGSRRADGLHRRLHDRLQRLLEVERLGDCLRDLREGLELRHAALRLRVELRVLDRLRDLVGNGDEQLDLVTRELPRLECADVERTGQPVTGEDRHGQDRLVLVLGEVREELEAWVKVGL